MRRPDQFLNREIPGKAATPRAGIQEMTLVSAGRPRGLGYDEGGPRGFS